MECIVECSTRATSVTTYNLSIKRNFGINDAEEKTNKTDFLSGKNLLVMLKGP